MEIIDLTKPKTAPKKIELLSCLQASKSEKINSNFFYETDGEYTLRQAQTITRVSKNASGTGLDLIIVNKANEPEEAWLGNWNDGIV